MKSPFVRLAVIVLVIIGLIALIRVGFDRDDQKMNLSQNGILQLDLDGVIINGKKFLKNLKKYRDNGNVKALLVVIDSPGGSVGPSQEIFAELVRTREEFKIPVICTSNGIVASGAYYAAAACDQLVVAPGSLIGSIGVIMGFANIEGLYDWAKVRRYSITSGKFKDSGAEYRPMRDDERKLFQDMIDEVYLQFKTDIAKGRKIKEEILTEYADGRVFTGAKAVELGFADKIGTYEEAVKVAAEAAKLGEDYDVFEVPKRKRSIFDFGMDEKEDTVNSLKESFSLFGKTPSPQEVAREIMKTQWLNQPVLLMPGYWQ